MQLFKVRSSAHDNIPVSWTSTDCIEGMAGRHKGAYRTYISIPDILSVFDDPRYVPLEWVHRRSRTTLASRCAAGSFGRCARLRLTSESASWTASGTS